MMAISHICVASHSLLACPPECAIAPPLQMVEAIVTLAAQSMASRAVAAAMASFIRAVALRLTAALSASGAAACCAAVLPLVLTTCGSKVQWHEPRPPVYCMLPKALDPWSSFVSPSSS